MTKKKLSTPSGCLLLSFNNTKTEKSLAAGYITAGLNLAPHREANIPEFNLCAAATPGCMAGCLRLAGRFGMIKADEDDNFLIRKRIMRTHLLRYAPRFFMEQLVRDHQLTIDWATPRHLKVASRLNVLSDKDWTIKVGGIKIMEAFPDIQFYDYTKVMDLFHGDLPANYQLVFSRSEVPGNQQFAYRHLQRGGRVAVVFDVLPDRFWGHPVIDGDEHDLVFLHPAPCLIGLKAKGPAKKDTTGFVVRTDSKFYQNNRDGLRLE